MVHDMSQKPLRLANAFAHSVRWITSASERRRLAGDIDELVRKGLPRRTDRVACASRRFVGFLAHIARGRECGRDVEDIKPLSSIAASSAGPKPAELLTTMTPVARICRSIIESSASRPNSSRSKRNQSAIFLWPEPARDMDRITELKLPPFIAPLVAFHAGHVSVGGI